jgi:hypothetical protein
MQNFLVLLSLVCLAGCQTLSSDEHDAPGGPQALMVPVATADALLVRASGPSTSRATMSPDQLLAMRASVTSQSLAMDRLTATTLISISDQECNAYLTGITVNENRARSALDLSALAFSSAASVASPERSANILSAAAAFVTGSRDSLEQTLLEGESLELIIRASRANREAYRSRLVTQIRTADARDDILIIISGAIHDYHAACGVSHGLQAIASQVERLAATATDTGQKDGANIERGVDEARDDSGDNPAVLIQQN